jgi:hypothetical protein
MNSDVKPHELNKASVITKAEQCGEIVRVILLCINRRKLASAIDIAVNAARDVRQLRDTRVCVRKIRKPTPKLRLTGP